MGLTPGWISGGDNLKNRLSFSLESIPQRGLIIDEEVNTGLLGLDAHNWPPLSGVCLKGTLDRTGEHEALFQGRVLGSFLVECSLGSAKIDLAVEEEITAYFQLPLARQTESVEEVQLRERDIEVYKIENDQVDLSNPVRDQLGLGIPIQPKCPEKCLGDEPDLCYRLKQGMGVGMESNTDSRLAALEDWGKD
ncbi:MAG: DUF177 domain-containing protein [Nitrospinota bacterium]